ncbi:alpha/beta fold hydrolase [Arthrobacter sp. AZCC_0090]|uniref:alpha/beta fold hydrolase n=1 Tax=Arthrobacter sp. AZCC_0090 TaxID=2735881 RepID=UPI001622732F|nr:alpha/beta hydrolase [Arthrobacter sp. AZCC_0090]MBB6405475.1 pimeloyl-ACP methyl ester carboxylesterase [Arthrobacter sp. AZCC_0090]
MPRVQVNGVDLYFEEHGDGVPILGLHGTPGSAVVWSEAAVELSRHGRCIIYDRRGFHRNAPTEPFATLDLIQHVDDAAALLAALHAGPSIIVGRGTGGQIALEFARHFPDKVKALVLLEPALFTIDPDADSWARELRKRILGATSANPSMAAEIVLRDALGNDGWESLPGELKAMFAGTSSAVMAEMQGHGLALSGDPLELSEDELAGIRRRTLIVSAEDSPATLRLVTARLAGALPFTESVLVPGGLLINPAHPAVLDFIDRIGAIPNSWT